MADTVVSLGDFDFQGVEVPERIPFGGGQMLALHKLPGGARVVDAMGRDDAPLEWSGRFQGADAEPRARYLDTMRQNGAAHTLYWSEFAYEVVIVDFRADYERFYQIPYTIRCEVIRDLGSPQNSLVSTPIDDALLDDMTDAVTMALIIADNPLISFLNQAQAALADIGDIFNAGMSLVSSVVVPLSSAKVQIRTLLNGYEAIAGAVTTIGGVSLGVYGQAPVLIQQASVADQIARLYELTSIVARMLANLNAAGTSGTDIPVVGGTLQGLAAQHFDDPNQWTAIAKANGLLDPLVNGSGSIRIPAKRDNSGGVLNRA